MEMGNLNDSAEMQPWQAGLTWFQATKERSSYWSDINKENMLRLILNIYLGPQS